MMTNKLTKIIGIIFFGGWALSGTFFYGKAVVEWIIKMLT